MKLHRRLNDNKLVYKAVTLNQFSSMGFRSSNILCQKKDFYQILGVPKNANKADIKKAYFQNAKKFHPDVNKSPDAKEKFAELNEAYETLGDEQKKRIYDTTGMTGDEQAQAGAGHGGPFDGGFAGFGGFGGGQGGPFWEHFARGGPGGQGGPGGMPGGGGSFRDIFEDFEDFFNMGQARQGGPRQSQAVKGKDVVLNVEVDFMEAVNGTQKSISYSKIDNCSRCNGTGAQPGTGETNCGTCGGSGFQTLRQGSMIFQTTCSACGGAGKVIKNP